MQIAKTVKIVLITFFLLFIVLNVRKAIISGNQTIEVTSNNSYYAGEKINFTVKVQDKKNSSILASKIKVKLLDSKKKELKNVKTVVNTESNETANITLDLPQNIEAGKYTLKIQCNSKKGQDVVKQDITVLEEKNKNLIISLDKGIYKPGDTINYRVLSIKKNGDNPIENDIEVCIFDGNENRVYIEKLKTSKFGITSGSFKLGEEINSGSYKITVNDSMNEKSKNFTVNPYVTPQFETSIKTDKENFLVNDNIKISVNSKYFFGEPVKNAKVLLNINGNKIENVTNEAGIFEYEHVAKEEGSINISAEVIDESNYVAEDTKTIYISKDIFKVEVLPEYETLYSGVDNNIYFLVKAPDGTGKKAYITVNMGNNVSKQVITDEQGIGTLQLTSSDIKSNVTSLNLKLNIKDMEGNTIEENKKINVTKNNGVLIKTDKLKYKQEDDITINLNSTTDIREQTIAICKNNQLLKLITTNNETIDVNLDDAYGLIDIYALDNNKYSSKNNTIKSKRTIFIKPNKKLNINIKTDKNTYEPKENLELELQASDENGNFKDTAFLVSLLDEAVLSLANNDLSIDNIKLALEDVNLGQDIDASSLYANIIDEKSESSIMALLLKQKSTPPNIVKRKITNIDEKEKAIIFAIIALIIFAIILLIYLSIKHKKIRKLFIHIFAFMGTFVTLYLVIGLLIYNFCYDNTSMEYYSCRIVSCVSTLFLAIFIYYIFARKIKNTIARIFIEYSFVFFIVALFFYIINEVMIEDFYILLFAIIALLIFPILTLISYILNKKNIKPKVFKKIFKYSIEIIKTTAILFLTFFLLALRLYILGSLAFIILNALYEFKFNKLELNIRKKKLNENVKNGIEMGVGIGVGIAFGFGLMALVIATLFILMLSGEKGIVPRNAVRNATLDGEINSTNDGALKSAESSSDSQGALDSARRFLDLMPNQDVESTDSEFFALNSDVSTIREKQNNTTTDEEEDEAMFNTEATTIEDETEVPAEKQEKVRQLFLESLCFIPELIAENGKVSTSIPISDNITTWKMQVVGNTLDGNIGYNTSSITVKKDFFANFTLPSNMIVGDEIKIPLTVYNYTNNELNTSIEVTQSDWFTLGDFENNINVEAEGTKMIYIPINVIKDGENSLKIKATANNVQDILQKAMTVKNKGLEVREVISSGNVDKKLEQDIISDVNAIENTKKLRVKFYPSTISQIVEGLENILKMPSGCFEQTSSSLYPDIMVLKYMQENGNVNEQLRQKALSYISSGYQRILTFEVPGEKGGYSLYGKSPSNPSLTAYGLMELTDLSTVYEIDQNVIENMKNYLYKRQKTNGSFDTGSTYYSNHIVGKIDDLTLNSYIIWALSEADSKDQRLKKSLDYLVNKIDKLEDSYTVSLAANALANCGDTKNATILIERLLTQIKENNNSAYFISSKMDPYGSYGTMQNLQTTALASLALSTTNSHDKTNKQLINYIISRKDSYGTWGSTQGTILSLRALVKYQQKSDISNQKISVTLNDKEQNIEIGQNALDTYELVFDNLSTENKLKIDMPKGKVYYEVVQEYNQDANIIKENSKNKIEVNYSLDKKYKVNDTAIQKIKIKNQSDEFIKNGMVEITIPQGFVVKEESLSKLASKGIIQKYEYNYSKIYLYIQDIANQQDMQIDVEYKVSYPGKITGGAVMVYDYYNPDINGIAIPTEIEIAS